ncbi:uncharacterized protein FOMMEDRAFT_146619 [Fomitiporia mediterranea MF3/22]|uniref:uncharacterized protein n=1 Tax=Fomitiporia mediterranea (strain MF3/22) TaxID=694068 RepID=UPI0004409008|nr:uncharacterized protein FOMMEDRAFT_146619 [Fomitiporia mediterranea MF3/22]EJD02797.1 hypothetical protein FOMMEDRAFT_146619 [Fomitiporia mediterranea MF3/22]
MTDHKANTTIISHPQLIHFKRKLDDLEEVHREGKREHAAEIERLKADHDRTRKANKDQAEQIARLKKHNELIESRAQDLKKEILAAQSEARELRVKLRVVEAERDKLANKQTDAAGLRKAISTAEKLKKDEIQEKEKRIAELQRLLAAEKQCVEEAETKAREQRTKLEKEAREARVKNTITEQRLQRAQAELKETESRKNALEREAVSTSDSLATRVLELEATLKQATEEYSRLSSSSAPEAAYETLKLEASRLHLQVARLERKLGNSEEQVLELAQLIRQTQLTNTLLSEQLRDAYTELDWQTKESKAAASLALTRPVDDSLTGEINEFLLEEMQDREEEQEVLLELGQAQLRFSYETGKQLVDHLSSTERSLISERTEAARLKSKLAESEVAITKLSQEAEVRRKERDELQNKVTSQSTEIFNLQSKLSDSEKALVAAESRSRTELAKREDLLRKERELTSRLNSSVHKAKMAEDALKAGIEQLTSELAGADAYREAYASIAEEMRGLVARNALAEDEANRLSQFNAEILSHRNPTQKILYVDRIRRELAETKQKLIQSTQDTESALSEISTLRDELAMYKSVTVPPEGKPRTAMTRVRRIPLGAQKLNVQVQAERRQEQEYASYSERCTYDFDGEMTIDELS